METKFKNAKDAKVALEVANEPLRFMFKGRYIAQEKDGFVYLIFIPPGPFVPKDTSAKLDHEVVAFLTRNK